jgi:hypothetical protein
MTGRSWPNFVVLPEQVLHTITRACYSLGVALSSPVKYWSTSSRMILLMVVPSSAAFFLKAV